MAIIKCVVLRDFDINGGAAPTNDSIQAAVSPHGVDTYMLTLVYQK